MKQQTIKEDAAAEDMWDRLERQNEEHKKSYDEFLRTLEKSCAKCPHVKTENKGTRAECAVCTHECNAPTIPYHTVPDQTKTE